jgi:hypothetical protein
MYLDFEPSGAPDCLTCLGKGFVTVKVEPLTRETCPACCSGWSPYDIYQANE